MRSTVFVVTLLTACSLSLEERVDALARRERLARGLPGMSVALLRGDEVLFARGYGLADLELGSPATAATKFEIGSCSKAFTALAVMRLVARGDLSLEDPLTRFWSGVPVAGHAITIRHALTHTSGLRNHVAVPGFLDDFGTRLDFSLTPSRDELLRRCLALPMEFEPGTSWAYDNGGYCLLAAIVERVAGVPFWRFLTDEVLVPAGLEAVCSTDPRTLVSQRASGYGRVDGTFENRPALPPELASGAGALMATALDLARLPRAMARRGVVPDELVQVAWTPMRAGGDGVLPYDYGFGWFVGSHLGQRFVQHGGGTPGCSAVVYFFPDVDVTVAVLANRGDRMLDALAIALAGEVAPELRRATAAVDPDPARTARLRGVVADLLEGRHAPGDFTPAMQGFLASASGRGFWLWHREHGELSAFEFAAEEHVAGDEVVHFRAALGDEEQWLTARCTAAGTIAQLFWW